MKAKNNKLNRKQRRALNAINRKQKTQHTPQLQVKSYYVLDKDATIAWLESEFARIEADLKGLEQ